jgi:hypothetical protein
MRHDRNDNTDLALSGHESVLRGLEKRLPYLSEEERENLADTLLDEIGKRIAAGEDLAFLKATRNGDVKLTHLDLDKVRRRLRG